MLCYQELAMLSGSPGFRCTCMPEAKRRPSWHTEGSPRGMTQVCKLVQDFPCMTSLLLGAKVPPCLQGETLPGTKGPVPALPASPEGHHT